MSKFVHYELSRRSQLSIDFLPKLCESIPLLLTSSASTYLPPTAPSTAHILLSVDHRAIDFAAAKFSRWSKAKMPTNRALAMLTLRVHTQPSSASFRELQNRNTQQRSRKYSAMSKNSLRLWLRKPSELEIPQHVYKTKPLAAKSQCAKQT